VIENTWELGDKILHGKIMMGQIGQVFVVVLFLFDQQ
jgi:hypothetical protein